MCSERKSKTKRQLLACLAQTASIVLPPLARTVTKIIQNSINCPVRCTFLFMLLQSVQVPHRCTHGLLGENGFICSRAYFVFEGWIYRATLLQSGQRVCWQRLRVGPYEFCWLCSPGVHQKQQESKEIETTEAWPSSQPYEMEKRSLQDLKGKPR